MARTFAGKDVHNWKVVTHTGKTFRDGEGKPLNSFDGYSTANAAALKLGGIAVRV
jgi:hypothetical protein